MSAAAWAAASAIGVAVVGFLQAIVLRLTGKIHDAVNSRMTAALADIETLKQSVADGVQETKELQGAVKLLTSILKKNGDV